MNNKEKIEALKEMTQSEGWKIFANNLNCIIDYKIKEMLNSEEKDYNWKKAKTEINILRMILNKPNSLLQLIEKDEEDKKIIK